MTIDKFNYKEIFGNINISDKRDLMNYMKLKDNRSLHNVFNNVYITESNLKKFINFINNLKFSKIKEYIDDDNGNYSKELIENYSKTKAFFDLSALQKAKIKYYLCKE
jgi:hypothetical protein